MTGNRRLQYLEGIPVGGRTVNLSHVRSWARSFMGRCWVTIQLPILDLKRERLLMCSTKQYLGYEKDQVYSTTREAADIQESKRGRDWQPKCTKNPRGWKSCGDHIASVLMQSECTEFCRQCSKFHNRYFQYVFLKKKKTHASHIQTTGQV